MLLLILKDLLIFLWQKTFIFLLNFCNSLLELFLFLSDQIFNIFLILSHLIKWSIILLKIRFLCLFLKLLKFIIQFHTLPSFFCLFIFYIYFLSKFFIFFNIVIKQSLDLGLIL
jgi:hypothetical protein